jgi:hypothetical protein
MALIQQNPSLPPDYLTMSADWFNADVLTVDAGQSVDLPPPPGFFSLPPVHGTGLVTCVSYLQGYVVGPADIECGIGVSNPSENNYPMRPFTGVSYMDRIIVVIPEGLTLPFHMSRMDTIDLGAMPLDFRSWTMNPGNTPADGRAGWPRLSASITNHGGAMVTVQQVNFVAWAK